MPTQQNNTKPELTLNFSLRTVGEWRSFLNRTEKTPWTQTFQYAIAVAKVGKQSTQFVTIDRGSEVVGLVAIQVSKLGPFQSVLINRGPVWFKGQETQENHDAFIAALKKTYPKSIFRRFRWMPEWAGEQTTALEVEHGFKKSQQSFETLWLDLKPSLEVLRKGLDRKWRGHLNKAERSGLEIFADMEGRYLDLFIKNYDLFKADKKFEGPEGAFFKHEIENALPFKDAIILWARLDKIPVAGVMVMKHGTSASYRVSWNSPEGRVAQAHYLLIWKVIEILKKQGVESFDLGGILAQDQTGFNVFKLGMNAEHFKTEFFK